MCGCGAPIDASSRGLCTANAEQAWPWAIVVHCWPHRGAGHRRATQQSGTNRPLEALAVQRPFKQGRAGLQPQRAASGLTPEHQTANRSATEPRRPAGRPRRAPPAPPKASSSLPAAHRGQVFSRRQSSAEPEWLGQALQPAQGLGLALSGNGGKGGRARVPARRRAISPQPRLHPAHPHLLQQRGSGAGPPAAGRVRPASGHKARRFAWALLDGLR